EGGGAVVEGGVGGGGGGGGRVQGEGEGDRVGRTGFGGGGNVLGDRGGGVSFVALVRLTRRRAAVEVAVPAVHRRQGLGAGRRRGQRAAACCDAGRAGPAGPVAHCYRAGWRAGPRRIHRHGEAHRVGLAHFRRIRRVARDRRCGVRLVHRLAETARASHEVGIPAVDDGHGVAARRKPAGAAAGGRDVDKCSGREVG